MEYKEIFLFGGILVLVVLVLRPAVLWYSGVNETHRLLKKIAGEEKAKSSDQESDLNEG